MDDLPERVQVELARFARDMWKEALVEAACRLDDDRALVRAERIACDTLRDEAWVDARAAEAAAQVLRARNAEMAEEIGALQREIRRLKAAEFWDRVMREIAGILPERDGMTAEEIARVLHPSFGAEAIVHAQPLTPGRIKRKMAIRVEHRKYFEYDGKAGVFRRRAGPRRGRP